MLGGLVRAARDLFPGAEKGMSMLTGITRAPVAPRLRALIARDPLFAAALAAGSALRLMAMAGYPGAL
jgi:hypothetical protein